MKNYIVKCEHIEENKNRPEKDKCKNTDCCAIHCHNNKDGRCRVHCERSWECDSEVQANVLRQTHIANESLHKPVIRKV